MALTHHRPETQTMPAVDPPAQYMQSAVTDAIVVPPPSTTPRILIHSGGQDGSHSMILQPSQWLVAGHTQPRIETCVTLPKQESASLRNLRYKTRDDITLRRDTGSHRRNWQIGLYNPSFRHIPTTPIESCRQFHVTLMHRRIQHCLRRLCRIGGFSNGNNLLQCLYALSHFPWLPTHVVKILHRITNLWNRSPWIQGCNFLLASDATNCAVAHFSFTLCSLLTTYSHTLGQWMQRLSDDYYKHLADTLMIGKTRSRISYVVRLRQTCLSVASACECKVLQQQMTREEMHSAVAKACLELCNLPDQPASSCSRPSNDAVQLLEDFIEESSSASHASLLTRLQLFAADPDHSIESYATMIHDMSNRTHAEEKRLRSLGMRTSRINIEFHLYRFRPSLIAMEEFSRLKRSSVFRKFAQQKAIRNAGRGVKKKTRQEKLRYSFMLFEETVQAMPIHACLRYHITIPYKLFINHVKPFAVSIVEKEEDEEG